MGLKGKLDRVAVFDHGIFRPDPLIDRDQRFAPCKVGKQPASPSAITGL